MNEGAALLFEIHPSSGVPIYRQIIDQLERLVASGTLEPGDELPSIREMARVFEVNQMTISKAYSLLEAKGVLLRNRGKRMVISEASESEPSTEQRLALMRPVLLEVVSQAKQLVLSDAEILKELERQLQLEGQNESSHS